VNPRHEPASLGAVEVIACTELAIYVVPNDAFTAEFWVPRSVIHEDSELSAEADEGDEGELTVHQWWADTPKENR